MGDEVAPGRHYGPLAFTGDEIVIGDLLGSGVSGSVYACKRVGTGDELAVKVIDLRGLKLLSGPEGQEATRKIENEVRVLREVQDRHCVGLYDIHRTSNWIMLVMERLQGGELFQKILDKKAFNEVEARHVFRQILDGLACLHSKRIIHRDLKPENVLVCNESAASPPDVGTLFEIKLCDYGLSRFMDAGAQPRTLVGTPQYWAPEVLDAMSSGRVYDERADLWSAGCLLYVMLRGQYPFKGADSKLADQIRTGVFDLSHKNWDKVSDEAKDLIRGLLKVDPAQRLTIDGCRQHPWFTGGMEVEPATPTANVEIKQPVDNERVVDNSAFPLDHLLQLQRDLARTLIAACVNCRDTHPDISTRIRMLLSDSLAANQQVSQIIRQYAQVAQQVLSNVLPDINLAVQEAEPSLAVELFDNVSSWVSEMEASGDQVVALVAKLLQDLQAVIQEATAQKLIEPPMGGTEIPGTSMVVDSESPTFTPSASSTAGRPKQELPKQLLQSLSDFAVQSAATEGESSECSNHVVDLLFCAPHIDPGSKEASSGTIARLDDMRAASSHPLLAAKQALRHVSLIIQEALQFWMAVGGTVKELARMKDHTKVLISHAGKNARLKERFDQRLREFTTFWTSLKAMCEQYCVLVAPNQQNITKFIYAVENAVDGSDSGCLKDFFGQPQQPVASLRSLDAGTEDGVQSIECD